MGVDVERMGVERMGVETKVGSPSQGYSNLLFYSDNCEVINERL